MNIDKWRRQIRFWLVTSALCVAGSVALILLGHRAPVNWVLLASSLANFTTFFLLRKSRPHAG